MSKSFLRAQQPAKQYQFRRIDITKGLSHNQTTTILKDSQGFIWFGTMSGLNRFAGQKFKVFKHDWKDTSGIDNDFITRIQQLPENKLLIATRSSSNIYDPATEKFNHHVGTYFASMGLPDLTLLDIVKTKQGDYYFLFISRGLYKYNSNSKKAVKITQGSSSDITSIPQSMSGDLWLIYPNGILEKLNVKTRQINYHTEVVAAYHKKQLFRYIILADKEDEIWMYTKGDHKGVLHFNPLNNHLEHINKEEGSIRLNNNIVVGLLQDNQDKIWISTDHGGINIINKHTHTIQYVLNNNDANASISQNSITSAYKDDQDIIWIGTFKKGVNCYHENIIKFPLYRHQPSNPNSLSYDDVNRFVEDAKGNIWIGTNGGGLIYFDRSAGKFTTYVHQPGNVNSLSSNIIVSLFLDKKGKLWIGSYFGGLDCFDGKNFTHYKHNPADKNSICDDRIWEIFEDKDSTLWIGTLSVGLDWMDRNKNIFYHYTTARLNSVRSNYISDIRQDKTGDLWIGTDNGCDVLEKSSGRFVHYTYNPADNTGLANLNVLCIFIDSRERHWIGTSEGLNLFNKNTQQFQHFTLKDGLPNNTYF